VNAMGDVFKEQIIKRQPTAKNTAIKAALIGGVAVIFFAGNIFIGQWGLYLAVAAGFFAYILMGRQNVEYEYIFTNGELDIDAIFNKAKRKRLFSGRVSDFDIMAHVEDKTRMGEFSSATETLDYSSGVVSSNSYAFLTSYKGKRLKIIIEPNEMMMKCFSSSLTPRKLFKKV
jgi:hypothetical protein